jgi:predicted phosphodiesterase
LPWFESGQALKSKGWTYEEIAKHHGLTEGGVRNRFYLERKRQGKTKPLEPQTSMSPLELLVKHKRGLQVDQLCDQLGVSERVLYATLDDLRDEGYIVTETNGLVTLQRIAPLEENHTELDWQGNQVIRFGVVSDTHLGSKWQQLTHLNTLYDIYEREGIRLVFNAGDLTEGVGMRRGHEFEVFTHGADEQVAYVIEHYPKRDGLVTQFITGNHDHSAIKQSGHDIGAPIERARPDMIYLGRSSCKVNITPNCIVEINHPLDGASYAISYALQKMIDAMPGGGKPNIYLGGHHHKAMYLFYRNIHAFECGTTQAQTPWMRGKRLPAHMGGWIIEVHVDDEGTVTRCGGEFVPFYTEIENDY